MDELVRIVMFESSWLVSWIWWIDEIESLRFFHKLTIRTYLVFDFDFFADGPIFWIRF